MGGAVFETRELFDPEFLDSLQRLRLVARRVPKGGRFAEQRSSDLGAGIEFRDYRPYSPGDDLRSIDWNIYRRLGRVFLRLFEELEDLPVYFMPDMSRSMFLEQPLRARAALRATLALSAVALGQHDSVGVFPFSDDLSTLVRPAAGAKRVHFLARVLAGAEAGGSTDTARALARLESFSLRRGLLVVLSDFFDPAGLEHVFGALKRVRHKLLLVQLARASDRDPRVEGDARLTDCESGASEDVSITPRVLERYRAAYDRFQEQLVQSARRRGAGFVRLDTDGDLVAQLAALFEEGRLAV